MREVGPHRKQPKEGADTNHGTTIIKNQIGIVPVLHGFIIRQQFRSPAIETCQHPEEIPWMIHQGPVHHRRIIVVPEDISIGPIGIKTGIDVIKRQGCQDFNYEQHVENPYRNALHPEDFPSANQVNSKKNAGQTQG